MFISEDYSDGQVQNCNYHLPSGSINSAGSIVILMPIDINKRLDNNKKYLH